MAEYPNAAEVARNEHIGPGQTGDNIDAKRVANYAWNSATSQWERITSTGGTWGYNAGTSGTLALSGNKKVLQITAIAEEAAATITINSGDTITLPYGSTDKVSSSITIEPKGNLIDPTIVFTSTKAYFVEYTT